MIPRRRVRNGLVLAAATLLFMVVLVAAVLLAAIVPSVVLFGIGLAVVAAVLLYLFVRRERASGPGEPLWRY